MKNTIMVVVAVMASFLLSGCGEKECFFISQEGKQLEAEAPVVWYDAYVGRVSSLEHVADGTKISIRLDKKYNDEIRDGVAGRVVNDPQISPKAFVLLIGGKDKERAALANGQQIPESKPTGVVGEGITAFVEWLKNCHGNELIIVGVGILIIIIVIKFVGKMIKFLLFVAIIAAIGYVCFSTKIDWSNYQDTLANVKTTAQEAMTWLQDHGEKLQTVLETVKEDKNN